MLSNAGTGLTLPFLVVYLHSVRGFGLPLAGAVAASIAVISLLGNPIGGWLADRYGPKSALLSGLSLVSVGAAGWAVVDTPGTAFAVAVLYGFGLSVAWPSQNALLSRLVDVERRSDVFAVGNVTGNLGLTVGGLISALIVDTARPSTFVVLYMLNAGCFVVALSVLARVRTPSAPPADAGSGNTADPVGSRWRSGYLVVARDRAMIRVWLLTALLSTIGFGQATSALPILATEFAGLAAEDLGLMYAAKTIAVVILQLIVLRLLAGHRRSRILTLLGLVWACSWALVAATSLVANQAATLGMLIVAMVVFSLGDTLLWPTLPAIVNDIAPETLRGRYNGAFTLALTTGMVLGPLLSGFALGHGWAAPLLVALLLACIGSALAARALEPTLPPSANIVPASAAKHSQPGALEPTSATSAEVAT